VTGFFLYDTILSFRLSFWANGLLVFLISLPLFLQGLWSVKLEKRIDRKVGLYTGVLSLILAEAAIIISFWPVNVASGSLFLISVFLNNILPAAFFHAPFKSILASALQFWV
jgi:hypothetical protein